MEKYDVIGQTYGTARRADPRITEQMITLLNLPVGSILIDVGAGTGNYSLALAEYGYHVVAVEPSLTMRNQQKRHLNLEWLAGSAEQLPLLDNTVDGIISTLAVHHFSDIEQSFREMLRTVRKGGPIVLFVSNPRECAADCWLTDYFAPILQRSYDRYPTLDLLVDTFLHFGCAVEVQPFLLPPDMSDRFFMTGWQHPEWYLDDQFRKGVSPLASAPSEEVAICVSRLAADLSDGTWSKKYGAVLQQTTCDGGYRFVVARGTGVDM